MSAIIFFFFQAEDGIRDIGVTGVQTCALPISSFGFPTRDEGQEPFTCRKSERSEPRISAAVAGTQRNEESPAILPRAPPVTTGWGGRHAERLSGQQSGTVFLCAFCDPRHG